MKIWVLTDETPHLQDERDAEFGVGLSLMGVFSAEERAVAYLEAEGHIDLAWEDDSERILIGKDGSADAVTEITVDEECWIVAENRPDLAVAADAAGDG